jgi:hypothetical protein
MPDRTRGLLIRGIAAAKSNEREEARKYLEWLLRLEPTVEEKEEAYYWLSQVVDNPSEKRAYLEEVLANNCWDARARRALAVLDGKINPNEMIDPDHIRQPLPKSAEMSDGKRFVCPRCGGRMTFTPDGQSMTCEFCESKQNIVNKKTEENTANNDFIIGMATGKGHFSPITVHAITCQGCGASFILPPRVLTKSCPYCHSAYVLKQVVSTTTVKPSGLIPFKNDSEDVLAILHEWMNSRRYKNPPCISDITGFYFPVWSFDMGGQIDITYQVEKDRYKWTNVNDSRVIQQRDIVIPATKRLSAEFNVVFQQYDFSGVVAFDESYLANWPAETYQVPMSDASLDAREITVRRERDKIGLSIGGNYRNLGIHTGGMQVESYYLLLFPVWLSQFVVGNNTYTILVNGQTGQVSAERPKTGSLLEVIFG